MTGRWRNDAVTYPTYYQIPYRSLIPAGDRHGNVITAGRMIDADEGAFGAVRVMVNTNQMGEAAGVAAYIALNSEKSFAEVPYDKLRRLLSNGGSIML